MTGDPPARPTVYTFWEPAGQMSPYLRLCLRTWERNLPGYQIVVLDRTNLGDYLEPGTLDSSALERLPLPMQKDALMVAVLERHGGVFMDVDTLVFRDLDPILEHLDRSEAVTLGMHMAFLAAAPGAEVLSRWRAGIQAKLDRIARDGIPPGGLPWDHLGNRELRRALASFADEAAEPVRARSWASTARFCGAVRERRRWSPRADRGLARLETAAATRRLRATFGGPLRHRLTLLDSRSTGFIAETAHFRSRRLSTRRKYERFWFEDGLETAAVTGLDPVVVGLHNSWTPQWFSDLSEAEALGGDCLLSRTLRHLLPG